MPSTTNFNWTTPADTDLVKDGASAIRTLGNGIDTSFVDLKGGTTGQVLSKASNTDLDFTWVAQDDSNAIQNAIVDAKGDLISATAADTPARLAVGANGTVLTADSAEATGLRWASAPAATFAGVSVYKSTNQSVSNATFTAITFDTEDYDTDAFHSTSSNTSRFTVPSGKAGKYLISGNIAFDANGTGVREIAIYKNGSVLNYGPTIQTVAATYGTYVPISYVLNLSVADYIEIFAFQNSGGTLAVQGLSTNTTIQFSLLGA
jgi:hypothetical protein